MSTDPIAPKKPLLLHGTCVALGRQAVLLRGPPGSGKSDLALRLIDAGWTLVADDYVEIEHRAGRIWAAAPAKIAGLIEVRGAGVIALPHIGEAAIALIVDLVSPSQVQRLPERAFDLILGVSVPKFALAAFEASTPAKIRAILNALDTQGFRTDLTTP